MLSKQLKKTGFILLTFILVLSPVGCSGASTESTPAAQSTGSSQSASVQESTDGSAVSGLSDGFTDAAYPIVLQHALGETVIESRPERVAAIAWGNQDVALALGVVPVGLSEANYGVIDGSGLLPWTANKLTELGVESPVLFHDTDGLDFEAISESQPDVILAAYSGITQEEYDLLSQIAPVVAYPDYAWQTYWRAQIRTNATGMGMQAEGEQLVSELEDLIAEKASEYPDIEGKSAVFIYFIPSDFSQFYIYLPADPRAAYLEDLGLNFPTEFYDLAEDKASFSLLISAENVDVLDDIDIIIAYGDDTLLESIQGDALLGQIPAISRGSVVFMENNTPLAASGSPSALSIPATIDEYLGLLNGAVQKAK